jgi:sugar transferase (PEP-CTERM system associated)
MWRVFFRYLTFRKFGAVIIENLLLVFCVMDAIQIRFFNVSYAEALDFQTNLLRAFVIAVVFQTFLHLRDVYDFRKTSSFGHFFIHLGQALILASCALVIIFYVIPTLEVGRGILAIALILSAIFLTIWHTLLRLYFGLRSPRSNVLVVGTGRLARELVTEILRHAELGINVVGFADDNPANIGVSIVNPKVIGLCQDLPKIVTDHKVDHIAVELQDRRGHLPIEDLLTLKTQGIAIEEATSLYERVTGKIALENLKPSWMIFNPGFEVSNSAMLRKRILSILISLLLLAFTFPVLILVVILIKLDSKGPAFHKQERVGMNGKTFVLWKFRSMKVNAEDETGPVWASKNDPRVTRIGRLLRRLRIDEFPQLYNVLRGDMSLVGPRPERPLFVKELLESIPFYHLRHAVKPGVTGWAQINSDYTNSVKGAMEKLQYDLFYVKNMSLLLDMLIVFETAKTVLVRKGS